MKLSTRWPPALLLVSAATTVVAACTGAEDLAGAACPDNMVRYDGACLEDRDADGVPDAFDGCPDVADPEQVDSDADGIGDACDDDSPPEPPPPPPPPPPPADDDGDGIADVDDNCVEVPNPDQADGDEDGTGDACELADTDGDGVNDASDNCPADANANQEDADQDGIGDVCDPPDADEDGVPDASDNCPNLKNPDQADLDHNNVGDACEAPDSDGDGLRDPVDNCPQVGNDDQTDLDGDGIGDACEAQDGSRASPIIIPCGKGGCSYDDARNTAQSTSDAIDSYPPYTQKETGPEYLYVFAVVEMSDVHAWIDTEPAGVDVDVHLLSGLSPLTTLTRGNLSVTRTLQPGTYYLSLDTYATSAGVERPGAYSLHLTVTPTPVGTPQVPIPIGESVTTPLPMPFTYVDVRSTVDAPSDVFDSYPPWGTLNESGREYIYGFTVDEAVYFSASIVAPEPTGVDVDIHLLQSVSPLVTMARDNTRIEAILEPGTYYLSLDTYNGEAQAGRYALDVTVSPRAFNDSVYFNDYVLKAVDYLYANYKLLGYDAAVLTHDIEYGSYGTIYRSGGGKTMCVAAVMEVLLTAMQLYAQETGDASIWDHLPRTSWVSLATKNIKAHLWVNFSIESWGTSDSLRHFGMGQIVPFEELKPGSFVNLNRTTNTGHAVVFIAYIDLNGNEYSEYNDSVVGFKYFSSQGSSTPGYGGLDYRCAVFNDFGEPTIPNCKRDLHIIRSSDQLILQTGVMFRPQHWGHSSYADGVAITTTRAAPLVSTFDPEYFDGVTTDDPVPPPPSAP